MVFVEYQVLLGYLRNSGFPEMGLNETDLHTLACSVYNDWVCYQVMLRTLRSKSFEQNIVLRAEESSLYGSYESIERYITTNKELLHPKLVVE